MTTDKQEIASLFTRTSGLHDTTGGLFAHFGSLLVEWSQLKPSARVLDVAAGVGASLVPAARRIGPSGSVVGVDLAPGMVARLQQVIEAGGLGNAEELEADAEQLPFADDSFDAVLCGFGLFFFPDPLRALAEFRRVARAGGTVALSTFTRDGSASMDRMWQRIGEYVAVPPPAADEMRFHEPAQLLDILDRAGFLHVQVEVSPFQVVLPDIDAWFRWLRSMEFGESLARMSPTQLEHLRDSARADFAGQTDSSEVRFPMDALFSRGRKAVR